MCGILGSISRRGTQDVRAFETALSSLSHRGPDAQGMYHQDNVMLGHRRLSIIDLDPRANQPMRVGSLVISFNGEIYNFRKVREDLRALGYQFQTESDTEVVALAYRHEGLQCLERLEGMFAIAIWNTETKRLTLIRDRFGEKPLNYYMDKNQFAFASEIGALESLLGRGLLALDEDALRLYFQFSYIPAPYTPYLKMRQLLPGAWVELDTKDWTLREGVYYELKPHAHPITMTEAVEALRFRLQESVRLRVSAADVPVATFLSGGLDSSIISVLAAQTMSSGVTAYSIGFPQDPGFDESPYARMVASQYPSIRHKVIDVTESQLLNFTDQTVSLLGEPYADASLIPTAYLCSHVEEKVILGGDGADEIFAGYGVYVAMLRSAKLPSFVKSMIRALPLSQNAHAVKNPLLRSLTLFQKHLGKDALAEYLSWRSYADSDWLDRLGLVGKDLSREILGDAPLDSLSALLTLDMRMNLPGDMLKKIDLASMQHGLEVRAPYLDRGLVEFALSLPERYLLNGAQRKYILREAFASLLPTPILTRRKQGFLMPIRRWFADGNLKNQLGDLLDSGPLDADAVRLMLNEHAQGMRDHSPLLWACYVFLKWHSVRQV